MINRIETERLIIRPLINEDAKSLYEGLKEFEVAKNLTVPYPYTLEHAKSFIESSLKEENKNYKFAIVLKSTGEVIGGTTIDFYKNPDKVKGGIWLNKKYIGYGYGTEAWRARAKFAFEVLGVEQLENGFFDFNEASKKMQLKVGYKIIGEKENFSQSLNKKVTEIVTLLKKEDLIL